MKTKNLRHIDKFHCIPSLPYVHISGASLALAAETNFSGPKNALAANNQHFRRAMLMCINEFSCRADTIVDR
jgi:hypothetical protein